MDHVAVFLEHVDLFNGLDWLYIELFQRRLEFLVVCAGRFVDFLYFSPWCTFAAVE